MTGPREELLSTGSLGPEGVALLYRTLEQVVRVRHLPPPEGADKWSPDMLLEAAHDVYLHRKGAERLLSLAAGTSDEDGFRQKLWRMVVNDLASMNRRTARGKLHERLKDVTAGMFGVQCVDGLLRLPGGPERVDTARFDELVAAAASVPVVVPAWDPLSERDAPIADRVCLEKMVTVVLETAGTALTPGELTAVLASRLGVHDAPVYRDDDGWERLAPVAADDPSAETAAADAAVRLLDAMTVREQQVLPYLEESVTVAAQLSRLGRTTAHKAMSMAKWRLEDLLAGDPDAASTLGKAVDIVRARWNLP